MIDSIIAYNKALTRLANKCEKLSREYTKLRDKSCVCGCGRTYGLDWAHGISRERERTKYHPLNTFRMNHEHHLWMDHSGKQVEFMIMFVGEERFTELRQLALRPFKPTIEWYEQQIEQLQTFITEVAA
ncbi:MAG: hypothetical protein WC879_03505 [Melioribacteraceae bacterium]